MNRLERFLILSVFVAWTAIWWAIQDAYKNNSSQAVIVFSQCLLALLIFITACSIVLFQLDGEVKFKWISIISALLWGPGWALPSVMYVKLKGRR